MIPAIISKHAWGEASLRRFVCALQLLDSDKLPFIMTGKPKVNFSSSDWLQDKMGHLEWSGQTSLFLRRPVQVKKTHIFDNDFCAAGNIIRFSPNWRGQNQKTSVKLPGAQSPVNTNSSDSWKIRSLLPSNPSIMCFPCGPSLTRPELRLKNWSTRALPSWLNLGELSVFFLAFLLSLFGTISVSSNVFVAFLENVRDVLAVSSCKIHELSCLAQIFWLCYFKGQLFILSK